MSADPVHGEGPIWDARNGWLHWVDVTGGVVHTLDLATGRDRSLVLDQMVGAVALREAGGLAVAGERGFGLLDHDDLVRDGTIDLPLVAEVVGDPTMRFNDGECDPSGRFWAGAMAKEATPGRGRVHRLDPDRTSEQVLAGMTVPNGMSWSDDGATLLLADSASTSVDLVDVEVATGGVLGRRPHLRLHDGPGVPDGITTDAEGGTWVAHYAGGEVRRYLSDGRVDRIVELPVSKPTSCCFAGDDLDQLWISTTSEELDQDERRAQPHAGSLFVCEPGVVGRQPFRFAG
nr:SMP-30/gluconolactonase/LRE family protein [Salsipaludibacter albus]